VFNVRVLERIADGLGIPRARMGLGYGEQGPQAPNSAVSGPVRPPRALRTPGYQRSPRG
jgi:hypothetical protein